MYTKFSQKIGAIDVEKVIQKESISQSLRNGLWNVVYDFTFNRITDRHLIFAPAWEIFFKEIWTNFFKEKVDEMDCDVSNLKRILKKWWDSCNWNELYDFLQFCTEHSFKGNEAFAQAINEELSKELSGYRVIGEEVVPIIDDTEIKEIQTSLEIKGKFDPAREHLQAALRKLSDRKKPDYRNSIKESISAVESAVKIIAEDPRAELGKALAIIEKRGSLSPALKKCFIMLYGYTSNEDGIRHALSDEPKCDFEEAKYMLVSCSAFVNYLIAKQAKD